MGFKKKGIAKKKTREQSEEEEDEELSMEFDDQVG